MALDFLEVCPTPDHLAAYVSGKASELDSDRIERHIDSCEKCLVVLSQLERRQLEQLRQTFTDPTPFPHAEVTALLKAQELAIAATRSSILSSSPDSEELNFQFSEGQLVGDFRIVRTLGHGTFGRVYLAYQLTLRRYVALKMTKLRSQESSLLAQLDHTHIIRIYDERRADSSSAAILILQYVPGGNLQQVLDHCRSEANPSAVTGPKLYEAISAHLDEQESVVTADPGRVPFSYGDSVLPTAWIGARLADALSYANLTVLHRDLKPANILLDANGNPFLADFNLSFGDELDGVRPDEFFGGTLPYMSPEQMEVLLGTREAESIGPPSDVYSLAILLWELAHGTRPFPEFPDAKDVRDRTLKMFDSRRTGEISVCSAGDVASRLDTVLSRCLSPDPSLRPSAGQVARTLYLETFPPFRELVSPTDAWRRTVLRWPLAVSLTLGFVPNVVLVVLNMIYNMSFVSGMDMKALARQQWNIVAISFAIGSLYLLRNSLPILWTVQRRTAMHLCEEERHSLIQRCLNRSRLDYLIIVLIWSITGLVYPCWASVAGTHPVSVDNYVAFMTSQSIFGLIAGSLTALAINLIDTNCLLPHLMQYGTPEGLPRRLNAQRTWTDVFVASLALSPILAILRLALLGETESGTVLFLCVMSLTCLGIGMSLLPRIRRALDILNVVARNLRDLPAAMEQFEYGGSLSQRPLTPEKPANASTT
ncbi:MAG: protein kinase [Planctomycetaceae bacterium]|nr:protein kinase [Planctomycetaceae bacterium]